MPSAEDWKLYRQRVRWYERNDSRRHRRAIKRELAARRAYASFPIHGEVLEGLRNGRIEIGENTLFQPHCWLTLDLDNAKIRIGANCFLNLGVMLAARDEITIGDWTMIANGCFIGDAAHRFDDRDTPVPLQGFTSKGPVHIGENCWLAANVVVTSGVTIGDRCVIGANSVVTRDIPPYSIAAGVPAKLIRTIEYDG
ncbi:MAG: acyltransferase [Thermoleophilia bacterium]|nr:acyltransferase [Thermoleophilia bacterium]